MTAWLSINVQPTKTLTHPASAAGIKWQKERLLHSLLVSLHSSATFTPTPVYCVEAGVARTRWRASWSRIELGGASVRRRCEDKIGVITALQQPRLMRRQEFSLASQYYLWYFYQIQHKGRICVCGSSWPYSNLTIYYSRRLFWGFHVVEIG